MWAMMLKLRMCAASITQEATRSMKREMNLFRLARPHPPSNVPREDNGVHSEEKGNLPDTGCGSGTPRSELPGQSGPELQQFFRFGVRSGLCVNAQKRFRAGAAEHEPGTV